MILTESQILELTKATSKEEVARIFNDETTTTNTTPATDSTLDSTPEEHRPSNKEGNIAAPPPSGKSAEITSNSDAERAKPSDSSGKSVGEISEQKAAEPIWDNIQKDTDFQKLEFRNPFDLLSIVDKNVREGPTYSPPFILYKWQVDILEGFGAIQPTQLHPHKFVLCAANGSGKDAFIVAPFAIWFITCKIKSKVIITSAGGTQLTTQTEKYISNLARKINAWYKELYGINEDILKIRQRHITCLLSGSEIHMFATDEEGHAEGHHPTEPYSEMAIIVNEAKNVPPAIYRALHRCTGFNYWLDISSPGEMKGDFYKHWNHWPNKKRVTYYDCPRHHSSDEFEEDKRTIGEHDPYFRSKWLALFTNIGGRYVVDRDYLEKLRNNQSLIKPRFQDQPIRIGIDIGLSTSGDESVISIWRGNKQLEEYHYRIQNAIELAMRMMSDLSRWVKKDHEYIFADDGGVGRPVIDILNDNGYRINRVLNQSIARNKKQFKNRGAQLWYKFARLIEKQLLIFKDFDKNEQLFEQIASRKYKESDANIDKMTLQSKKDMMAEGIKSPDRADAAVLAFCGINLKDWLDGIEEIDSRQPQKTNEQIINEVKNNLRQFRSTFNPKDLPTNGRHSNYSLSAIMKSRRDINPFQMKK